MIELESSDESLKGDYNATTEQYNRFDLRLIGHGKHLKTLQDETHAHYEAYTSKMDSIDVVFERMKLDIEQLEERLIQKLDRLNDEIRNVSESFDSYKRKANRTAREMKNNITTLRDDLTAIDKQLNPEKYEEKEE
jgi:seryl-tRNA synthetase